MERIPFDFTEFKQGAIAINSCGDEFTFVCCIGDKNIKIQDQERNYGVLSLEFAKNHWTMKPKEDDIWSDWISHDGSECPIPEVKAGDYEIKLQSGAIPRETNILGSSFWCPTRWKGMEGDLSITAYRIKKHLLKPEREIGACHYCETPIYLEYTRDKCVCEGCAENSSLISYPAPCTDDWTVCEYAPEEDLIIDPELPPINKPYTPKDQYILNYVHEEPKGVLHEDEGMSRLLSRLMK